MLNGKPNLVSKVIAVVLMLGVVVYHSYTVEQMKGKLEESNEKISQLEEQQISYTEENKALSEELDVLESEHLDSLEKIKTYEEKMENLEKDIQNKENEIDELNKDLQAKKKREKKEARLAKESKKKENDKSTVLSKEDESKPEQSKSNNDNSSDNTNNKEVVATSSDSKPNNNLGTFEVTYYSAYDGAQIGVTRGGTDMANGNIHTSDGYRIIAVDPNTIPFGSIVRVTTSHGESFMAKADDTGGKIKGNRIDIAVSTPEEAFALGRGTATVEIVN